LQLSDSLLEDEVALDFQFACDASGAGSKMNFAGNFSAQGTQ
jgi:hypothetical protein